MLVSLLSVIIITILSYYLYKPIRKFRYILFVITAIIAIASHEELNYITMGYIGFSFFIVVMFSGVLEKGIIRKRLFAVRSELAIIGTIIILPHSITYILYVLEVYKLLEIPLPAYIGTLALLIVIPLFITSFEYIRRKMPYRKWKALHQYSYFFFGFVGLHLILIGNDRQLLYIILFATYFGLKTLMYFTETRRKKQLLKNKKAIIK